MLDNGSRHEHSTGALREDVSTKEMRPELIPTEALIRVAKWYGDGAHKYGDRNWEKGLPFTNCIGSMFRHLIKYMDGRYDEDHLAAIAWNANALMHYEKHNPDMDDRPDWSKNSPMGRKTSTPVAAPRCPDEPTSGEINRHGQEIHLLNIKDLPKEERAAILAALVDML